MKKNKFTQIEIARMCGININTLYGWIKKDIYPPVIDAYNIAHTLGVTVDFLVAGKDAGGRKTEVQIKRVKKSLKYAEEILNKIDTCPL
jgi:transcriptional regulator with XRE-family HTH domain